MRGSGSGVTVLDPADVLPGFSLSFAGIASISRWIACDRDIR